MHCHAIQWFFVDFLRQKNGADPTEAAPDQTNRGAGLVKIRASQSRDSACGNGSTRRPAIRPSLRRRAQEQLYVYFSSSCFAEVPSIFSSFCLFPGGTPPIVHLPNVDSSGLFADLLSSNTVPEGLPNRGQRQERPRLAGAHNSAGRQSTRKVLSSNWLLPVSTAREIERDRQKGRSTRLLQQQLAKPDLCQRACRRSCTDIGPPRRPTYRRACRLHLHKVESCHCEALRPWKIPRPPLFFPTTKWRKKSLNSVTVHL